MPGKPTQPAKSSSFPLVLVCVVLVGIVALGAALLGGGALVAYLFFVPASTQRLAENPNAAPNPDNPVNPGGGENEKPSNKEAPPKDANTLPKDKDSIGSRKDGKDSSKPANKDQTDPIPPTDKDKTDPVPPPDKDKADSVKPPEKDKADPGPPQDKNKDKTDPGKPPEKDKTDPGKDLDPVKPPNPPKEPVIVKLDRSVRLLAISPENTTLVAVMNATKPGDRELRFLELPSGKELTKIKTPDHLIEGLFVVPDGKSVLAGGANEGFFAAAETQYIRTYDSAKGKSIKGIAGFKANPMPVAFTADGSLVAGGESVGKIIRVLDAKGKVRQAFEKTHKQQIHCAVFTPDAKLLISAGSDAPAPKFDSKVIIWDMTSGKEKRIFQGIGGEVKGLAVSSDGKLVAAAVTNGPAGSVQVWDIETGAEVLVVADVATHRVLFGPDDKTVIAAHVQGPIHLYDLQSNRAFGAFIGHKVVVDNLVLTSDGKTLISAAADRTIRLWDFTAPQLMSDGPPVGKDGPPNKSKGTVGTWARSGPARENALKAEGGTKESEEAVSRGLQWLARQQLPDGRWQLDGNFQGKAASSNDGAATALALLPFLGAGYTHKPSKDNGYDKVIDRGLRWLIFKQDPKRGEFPGGMYAHAIATIAMCEAYGLTKDPMTRFSAQRAINYSLFAQHTGGGWRYAPNQEGDTSVTGWQLMAFKAAQLAGLDVPEASLKAATRFLDSCMSADDFGYGYLKIGSTPTNTAIGLFCRQKVQGWGPTKQELVKAIDKHLLAKDPGQANDIYHDYYVTNVLFNAGGDNWTHWNAKMLIQLLQSQDQEAKSFVFGSWSPAGDKHASAGGRLMQTSFSLLCLEVYYRYPPAGREPQAMKDPA